MIVVGSRAIKFFIEDFREPKDWDIIGSHDEIQAFLKRHKDELIYAYPSSPRKIQVLMNDETKIEFELDDTASNQILSKYLSNFCSRMPFYDEQLKVCPLTFSMLMKRSTLYWNVHWEKNIHDYHRLSPDKIPLNVEHKKFLELRIKENEEKFGKKNISMNMPEKEFFGKSKKIRIMEHDLLHTKVMFGKEPLYKRLKIYDDRPLLSKEKFFALSFDEQVKTAQEECLAIGFERFYIPKLLKNEKSELPTCYKSGIKLVVTKLTKGWFCDFIIENYERVVDISQDHLLQCEQRVTTYFTT